MLTVSAVVAWGTQGLFSTETVADAGNMADVHVRARLRRHGLSPAANSSDAVFLRRIHLDVTGMLPTAEQVVAFLEDESSDKRERLIDELLVSDACAEYWSMKWCDLLRVKAEYPIKLWPNGVQAYHRWILAALRENRPYDAIARELLTSSGSNFRTPAVNFYRATQGDDAATLAEAAALTFMGVRLDGWPTQRRAGVEELFSRVAFKGTAEWKETIVYNDPLATNTIVARMPDDEVLRVLPGEDPRVAFADWLIHEENPWFARNMANRVWYWLMGRGLIHEPDDLRPDNPPCDPELLAYLAQQLVGSGYDLRHLYRLILTSRTYQQACIPAGEDVPPEELFACCPVQRLGAEVLIDALTQITGVGETYSSPIPEPFTFVPEGQRSVMLADGSITSPFLEMFGRPSRDTGLASERNPESTAKQRLHMLNSSHIQTKLTRARKLWSELGRQPGGRNGALDYLYLTILSRYPTDDERRLVGQHYRAPGSKFRVKTMDLVWALINTKEFQYRH